MGCHCWSIGVVFWFWDWSDIALSEEIAYSTCSPVYHDLSHFCVNSWLRWCSILGPNGPHNYWLRFDKRMCCSFYLYLPMSKSHLTQYLSKVTDCVSPYISLLNLQHILLNVRIYGNRDDSLSECIIVLAVILWCSGGTGLFDWWDFSQIPSDISESWIRSKIM